MFEKIIVPIIFLTAQFVIAGYGYFTGKMPAQGNILGIAYDSVFARMLIVQFKYVWILILLNFLYSIGFHLGFSVYKNFIVIATIWIASGPLAALVFNAIFVKEKLDPVLIAGIFCVTIGAIGVVAHKEIMQLLNNQKY